MARQPVPEAVKRQLRQEAAFGCCNCGHPFIQYHHIIPYAEEKHMRPEDMMAVCGNCHYLLTTGAVPTVEQRKWKQRPYNIVEKRIRGTLFTQSTDLRVRFAGGVAINTPILLEYGNGLHILVFERADDGRILVSAIIQNKSGEVVAQIARNEWAAHSSKIWDFELFPMRAVVRSAPGKISFGVDCRKNEILTQGEWFLGGQRVQFSPSICKFGENRLTGFQVQNCRTFLSLG